MTKKQYNQIVSECKSTTCFDCGCKKLCSGLSKVMETPFLKFYSELTIEDKLAINKNK